MKHDLIKKIDIMKTIEETDKIIIEFNDFCSNLFISDDYPKKETIKEIIKEWLDRYHEAKLKTIEDKLIEYLDNIIVTDDHGQQWLSVEFNEMEEEIRKLFKEDEK